MPARDRNGIDHFGAQFIRKLTKVGFRQGAHIGGARNAIKQGRMQFIVQNVPRPRPVLPGLSGGSVATVYNETCRLTQKVCFFVK